MWEELVVFPLVAVSGPSDALIEEFFWLLQFFQIHFSQIVDLLIRKGLGLRCWIWCSHFIILISLIDSRKKYLAKCIFFNIGFLLHDRSQMQVAWILLNEEILLSDFLLLSIRHSKKQHFPYKFDQMLIQRGTGHHSSFIYIPTNLGHDLFFSRLSIFLPYFDVSDDFSFIHKLPFLKVFMDCWLNQIVIIITAKLKSK